MTPVDAPRGAQPGRASIRNDTGRSVHRRECGEWLRGCRCRRRHAPRRRGGQRGAALLTAMMIVVLVATLASAMVWQQWRAVQVETAERARTQSAWILNGALDWARLILREDAISSTRTGDGTTLGASWATPLAEARLSTFLAADKDNNTDDGPPAFLSGAIADAQAKYNLRNLVVAEPAATEELKVLQRLFETIGVSAEVASRISNGLRDAAPPASLGSSAPVRTVDPPLMPQRVAQLAWFGLDAGTLARLEPFVTLLPVTGTKVNLNTAPREVLAAVIGVDLAAAERLRSRAPFKTLAEATAIVGSTVMTDAVMQRLDMRSDYFEVRGRMRLEDRVLEEVSLVQRRRPSNEVVTLQRDRVASRLATP